MGKRTTKITMVVAITVVLVLGLASVALASSWTDLPDSVLASYGISNAQVNQISQGYTDGTWKPYQSISRAQFTKMADATFDIALTNPATATFADVARTNCYYQYIEGAYAAGLVNGVTPTTFAPFSTLTREQAVAIIARAVAAEQDFDLASLTSAQISVALGAFHDAASVSTSLRDEMAFAVIEGITKGTNAGNLAPQAVVARIVGATLLIRAGLAEPVQPVVPAQPVVTAISPAAGSYAGGTSVTITGTGFTGTSGVKFGTVAATSFTVVSDTSITAVAPAGTVGSTVDVTVTTPAGTSALVAADRYTYGVVPVVTSITPDAGKAGDILTIYGTNFTGARSVTFGGVAASFIVMSDSQITAVAPAGLSNTTVHVQVGNAVGMSATSAADEFTFYAAPVVTGLSPVGGPLSTSNTVTITGSGFTGVTAVKFGTVDAASYIVQSSTTIRATTTNTVTSGQVVDVTVVTSHGTSAISAAARYTFGNPPTVTITPTRGKGGTVVTITGSGFVGVTAVKFGSVPATSYIVQSDSLITAVAPAGTAGSIVGVTVTASTGTSAAAPFTYDALPGAPTVTRINPVSGPTGTTVIITGTGFLGATAVTFGTIPATSFIVANDGLSITAEAPAGTVGSTVDVTVTTSAGTSAISALDKFFYGTAPVVAYITPTTGPAGTLVTINGSGFAGVTGVTFGGVAATQISYVSPYQITAVAPTGLAGPPVDVVVTTPAGSSATSATSKYSYGAPQADVAFALTSPTGAGDSITGGGAVKTVAVSVVNDTASVVLTGTKLAGQAVAIAGANAAVVSATGTDIAPTYTVNTTSVAAAGGEMVFTLTVSETGKADIVYTVTVTVALNPAKAITAFTIPSQTDVTEINETDHTIALTMPAGTDVAALVATITITGASVSPASEVAQDFSDPVTYTVTAADATTQTYTVTVTVAAYATAPSDIVLAAGSVLPVGAAPTNVAIPAPGATDDTGKVTGWTAETADTIAFTVTNGISGTSTITIGGNPYTSGGTCQAE